MTLKNDLERFAHVITAEQVRKVGVWRWVVVFADKQILMLSTPQAHILADVLHAVSEDAEYQALRSEHP